MPDEGSQETTGLDAQSNGSFAVSTDCGISPGSCHRKFQKMLEEAPGEDEQDEEVEEEHMAMGRVLSRAEALELVESELVAFVHKLGEGFCEVLGKSMGQDARLFMRTVSVLN